MKNFLILLATLATPLFGVAQSPMRVGVYNEGGKMVVATAQTSLSVSVTVRTTTFTPGIYARYAQKLLGTRASLLEKSVAEVASAQIVENSFVEPLKNDNQSVETASVLDSYPKNRTNGSALTAEQLAAQTADQIFTLRRHRNELISGDAGENVFGAGLAAALAEITEQEQTFLKMFYGTTTITTTTKCFNITPKKDEKSIVLCRLKADEGFVGVNDLSGDPITLCIEPIEVDLQGLTQASDRDKATEFLFPATCELKILVGANEVATTQMKIYQFGRNVRLAIPLK